MQTVTSHTSQRGVMTTSQQDTAEKAAQLLAQIAETRSRQALGDGLSLDEGNALRKLLTKKGTGKGHEKKTEIYEKFVKGCTLRGLPRESADELWPILAEQNDNLDDDYALDQDILLQEISHYYGQLPDAQRIVVEKIYVEGKSQQEVSDSLGIPLGTVKSRTRLALKKLKELIVEHD